MFIRRSITDRILFPQRVEGAVALSRRRTRGSVAAFWLTNWFAMTASWSRNALRRQNNRESSRKHRIYLGASIAAASVVVSAVLVGGGVIFEDEHIGKVAPVDIQTAEDEAGQACPHRKACGLVARGGGACGHLGRDAVSSRFGIQTDQSGGDKDAHQSGDAVPGTDFAHARFGRPDS